MVTDEIQKVTELEQEVKQKKENAAAQNKQRVSQAQRAARLAVEQARQQAETEAGAMMAEAEAQARAWAQDVLEQARQGCEARKAQMRSRLDGGGWFSCRKGCELMAIVKMKRLGLLAMREDREAILHALQGLGCVEISEPTLGPQGDEDAAPAEQLLASLSSPDTRALADAQARHHDAQRAMEVLRHDGAKGRGFLSPKPGARRDELYAPQAMAQQDKAVADVLEADRQVTALLAQQEKLAAQRASLAPWLGLDVPLCTASTPDMLVQFGTLTAGRPLEEATRAVQNASELACLTQASASRELRYCLLVCHSSVQDAVLEALRGLRLGPYGPERLERHSPGERQGPLCPAGTGTGGFGTGPRAAGRHARPNADALCRASDRALLDIHLQESRALLRDTRQVFLLQGWVPAGRWEEVQAALAKYPCAWEVADPPESEYPQVPVQLKNNWFTRPLNMVTEIYLPARLWHRRPQPPDGPVLYSVLRGDDGRYGLRPADDAGLGVCAEESPPQSRHAQLLHAAGPVRHQHFPDGRCHGRLFRRFPHPAYHAGKPRRTLGAARVVHPAE